MIHTFTPKSITLLSRKKLLCAVNCDSRIFSCDFAVSYWIWASTTISNRIKANTTHLLSNIMWLPTPIWGRSHFHHHFQSSWVYHFHIKVKIIVLVEWSYMLTRFCRLLGLRMVIIFRAHDPIHFLTRVFSFMYMFLEMHQTTYHSTVGV